MINETSQIFEMIIGFSISAFFLIFIIPRLLLWLDKKNILKMDRYNRRKFKELIGR
jgi:hypothetical protein